MAGGFVIVGQGLAGSCAGWWLRELGAEVRFVDDRRPGSASRVAAGLVNPVTGKNFEPSWRLAEFLPEAVDFYRRVERRTGRKLWFPLPVVRLVSGKDWEKVGRKLERPEVACWVERVAERTGDWRAEVVLAGGGRLDVRGFCEAVAEGFAAGSSLEVGDSNVVRCEGAAGLMTGALGEHRCAKGEILTVRIPGRDEGRVLIGGGGWLVPLGGGLFKVGATYDWEDLDGVATAAGRAKIEGILARLGVEEFEVVAHAAGVRPIVRRSMPLIGRTPRGEVVFNGLGSKGAVYAPGAGRRLAEWLVQGRAIDPELDVARFMADRPAASRGLRPPGDLA